MSVQIDKKSVLFYKALEDVWVAEQIWRGSPNNAAWHCTQAVEKAMKGCLSIYNSDFDHGHELKDLLEALDSIVDLPLEITKHILYIDRYKTALRYKTMVSDPTPDEAKLAITRTKEIINELGSNSKISDYMNEAKEVHIKMLKSSSTDN